MNSTNYGPMNPASRHLEQMAAVVRTNDHGDHDVLAAAVASLVLTAMIAGMTPEEVGSCAALVLVDKGGFHRRHHC